MSETTRFPIDYPLPHCQDQLPRICNFGNGNVQRNLTVVDLSQIKPALFHCGGYATNRNLEPTLKSLLPEYKWKDLRRVSDWRNEASLDSKPWDIFVSNYQLDECTDPGFFKWLHLQFAGKIVFWTPEDATKFLPIITRPNYYPLGPGAPITLTFLQTAFWAQIPMQERQDFFFGSPSLTGEPTTTGSHLLPRRPRSSGEHFLIYAHGNCVGERQTAFRQIANNEPVVLPQPHFGGRCNGNIKNQTKAIPYPNNVRLANWEANLEIFKRFRFCLTMEHVDTPGYITEKILLAFWAGCLPIYWGPKKEIEDIFHPDAFIYWDVSNPRAALDQIVYLERNRSAFGEAMGTPILAPGAVEKYFSLDDSVGGGSLKKRIRTYLGLDEFLFASNTSSV